jgi:hypothetical protein
MDDRYLDNVRFTKSRSVTFAILFLVLAISTRDQEIGLAVRLI